MTGKNHGKKKDYEKMAYAQLGQLERRLKAMKQMPELVANRNMHLMEQKNRNEQMDYERIRQRTRPMIPPYMANKENVRKVLAGQMLPQVG